MADDKLDYKSVADILKKPEGGERRKRNYRDAVTRLPNILALISGLLVFIVWLIWNSANPNPTGSDWGWLSVFNEQHTQVRRWPGIPINIAYIMLLVSVGLCVIALAVNKMRMRRKTDRYSWAVFFIGALAIITLTVFLIQFIPMNIIGRWY